MLEISIATGKKKVSPTTDFLGEVAAVDFITASALATACTYTAGTLVNPDSPWLHFIHKGLELYVAKLPIRTNVGWMTFYAKGMVHGDDTVGIRPTGQTAVTQNRRVTINGKTYRVRLLKGGTINPYPTDTSLGNDTAYSVGSEWNDLFYLITNDAKIVSYNGPKIPNPYVPADFGLSVVASSLCNCQELNANGTLGLTRGNNTSGGNIVVSAQISATGTGATQGWRPCLELIP